MNQYNAAILEAAEQIVLEAVQQQQQQQQQQQRSTAMTIPSIDQRPLLDTHHTLSPPSPSSSTTGGYNINSNSLDTGENLGYGGTLKGNNSHAASPSSSSTGAGDGAGGLPGGGGSVGSGGAGSVIQGQGQGGALMLSHPEDLDQAMMGAQMMHLQRQLDLMKAQMAALNSSQRSVPTPTSGISNDSSGSGGGGSGRGDSGGGLRASNNRHHTTTTTNNNNDDDAFDLAIGVGRSQPLRASGTHPHLLYPPPPPVPTPTCSHLPTPTINFVFSLLNTPINTLYYTL